MSGVQRGLRTLTLVGRCGFGAKQMTRTLSLKSGIFIPSLNIRFPRPNLVLHRCGNHYPGQILYNETASKSTQTQMVFHIKTTKLTK